MPIDATINPELAKALAVQERYRQESAGDTAGNRKNLFSRLGTLASAIYRDEEKLFQTTPQPQSIRVYTFNHAAGFAIQVASLHPQPPTENETVDGPLTLAAPWQTKPEFATTKTTWLVGYDIETQSYDDGHYDADKDEFVKDTPSHCVSHQWYFNFQGVRFGFIFLTRERISQAEFVTFLDRVIPDIKDPKILKNIKVYAHFSVYESGWMHVSPATPNPGAAKKPGYAQKINERNDEWCESTELRSFPIAVTATPTGKPSKAKPKQHTIRLEFCDSIKLQAGSLEKLGETIGINKIELPKDTISHMAQYLTTNPKSFCEYGIIDSIIAAEAHLYFFSKYKTCMLTPVEQASATDHSRMPGYSNEYFRNLFIKKYGEKGWKKPLGYDANGMTLINRAFVHFFHGGRNDVLSIGPRGEAYYLDLHSAYLTSVAMLKDYDFSAVTVTTGAAAEKRLEELYQKGPFQVVGIECSFRFKDTVDGRRVKPIFPVRIDEAESLPGVRINFNSDGIIYPKSGKSNLTMPEFWVARHNGLIEQLIVHRVIEFTEKDTNWFAKDIIRLLILRKDSEAESDKFFYKNILNFFFGKTCQGVKATAAAIKAHNLDQRVNASSMTCYPLASYITGFCRATVGELLQHNPCYGITTDGFITPVSREKLVIPDDSLSAQVQKNLEEGGFLNKNFIGCEASATISLFLKTRGYLLIGPDKDDPVAKPEELQKMAAMGVKIDKKNSPDPVKDFLDALRKGYADKKSFVKLNQIRKEQLKNRDAVPEQRIQKNVKVDSTFDMKHLPKNPVEETFTWNGEKYCFTSFETEPLDTATDFHILRALRGRDHTRDLPAGLLDKQFPFSDIVYNESEFQDYDPVPAQTATAPATPETQQPAPAQAPPAPQKVKTMVINGVKKPQTLDYDVKKDTRGMIDLLLRSRSIPRYMEVPDYERMLRRFTEFRRGTGAYEQLSSTEVDYADLQEVPEGFSDDGSDWQDDEN